MIAVRIDDLSPGGLPRRAKLYELLGNIGVRPTKINDDKHMYFALIDEQYLETILDNANKAKLKKENFEVIPPLEYKALKTIVVKQVDTIIDCYENNEIKDNIERINDWAKVEEVFKLPTTSKIVKV